jgi:CBS domain-containing protein
LIAATPWPRGPGGEAAPRRRARGGPVRRQPVGVLTDRDVALALAEHGNRLADMPVAEIMSRDLVTIAPDAALGDVKEAVESRAVRRNLVVDADGVLRGIIAWADLIPHLSRRAAGEVAASVAQRP